MKTVISAVVFARREMFTAALAGLMGFGGGAAIAAESVPVPATAKVANSQGRWIPVPFGEGLELSKGGKAYRTLWLFQGRGPADLEDPNSYKAYHQLPLALVAPPSSEHGHLCDMIHELDYDGDHVFAEFRFLRTNRTIRQAAEAHLWSKKPDFFAEKAKGKPGFKVVVEPAPVEEIVMLIRDRNSKLILSHDKSHVVGAGDEIAMRFAFTGSTFKEFCVAWKEGRVEFQPYLLVSANEADLGTRRTKIDYAVKDALEATLNHDQRDKRNPQDSDTPLPILRRDKQKLVRHIMGDIKDDLVGDSETVLTALPHNDAMLNGLFARVQTVDAAEFTSRFPAFNAQALADYLRPMVEKHLGSQVKVHAQNRLHSDSKTDTGSSGFGVSLFGVADLSVGGSNAKQSLDALSEESGVQFSEGTSSDSIIPTRIEVHQLSEGALNVSLTHVSTVAVGRGQVEDLVKDSPFTRQNDVNMLTESMLHSIGASAHLKSLMEEKSQLIAARTKATEAIKAELDLLRKNFEVVEGVGDKLAKQKKLSLDNHIIAGIYQGYKEWASHIGRLSNQLAQFEHGYAVHMVDAHSPGVSRQQYLDKTKKDAAAADQAFVKDLQLLKTFLGEQLPKSLSVIETSHAQIMELNLQITQKSAEIEAFMRK